MWGHMMNNSGYWAGGMFMISHVLWWVFIAMGFVMLMRSIRSTDSSGTSVMKEDSAIRILRKQYAHGAISKEEFEERKRGLQI